MTSTNEFQARERATAFRRQHRLGTAPIPDLVTVIEDAVGIDVAVLDADSDEHGLSVRNPDTGRILIGVARTAHPMRQRSTLAHELGHVLFDDFTTANNENLSHRSPAEIRADAFARHLLIPVDGVRKFFSEGFGDPAEELSRVVRWFRVSPVLALIVLRDCGYVSQAEVDRLSRMSTQQLATLYGWMDVYSSWSEASMRHKSPRQLMRRALLGYVDGLVSAQVIANMQGVGVDVAVEQLKSAGIEPIDLPGPELDDDWSPPVPVDMDDFPE